MALGGPIIKDKLWFMGEFRYIKSKDTGDFRPTVINGKQYDNYDRVFPNYVGFLKLSAQLTKNIRASAMGHYSMQDVPYYYSGWGLTDEANIAQQAHPLQLRRHGLVDRQQQHDPRPPGRRAVFQVDRESPPRPAIPTGPLSTTISPATAGATAGRGERYTYKPKFNISLTATKFLDNFLGGNHELKAGLEWERNRGDWGFYMTQPLFWTYYDGSPYYYRALNDGVTDPVYGDGLLDVRRHGHDRGVQRRDRASPPGSEASSRTPSPSSA